MHTGSVRDSKCDGQGGSSMMQALVSAWQRGSAHGYRAGYRAGLDVALGENERELTHGLDRLSCTDMDIRFCDRCAAVADDFADDLSIDARRF